MNVGQMTVEDRSRQFHFNRNGETGWQKGYRAVKTLTCEACHHLIDAGSYVLMFGSPRRPFCMRCIPSHAAGESDSCEFCELDRKMSNPCPTCRGSGVAP